MSLQAERVYQIADQFREWNLDIKIVLGGIHPTFLPEEAKQHADAVIVGEAESVWERVLNDAEVGWMDEFYYGDPSDLQELIIPRWECCDLSNYRRQPGSKWPLMPVFTTRGCPFGCKFCSVTHLHGKSYRHKPIGNILQEIEEIGAETYFFVDDNIMANPAYSRELFQALQGKGIHWFSQASTTMLKHPEIIDLAAKAGCFSLFIGIESIHQNTLAAINKNFNKTSAYKELFERLYRANIIPYTSHIFGFDQDTPETFQETLEFLKQHRIMLTAWWLLTPVLGTAIFDEMKASGRIFEKRWSFYEGNHVVFQPKNFSSEDLTSLYWHNYQKFFEMTQEINLAVKNDYPSLPGSIYLGAYFFQLYAKKQVLKRTHPFAIGSGKKDEKNY